MTKTMLRLISKGVLLGALLCPATLFALGLGDIHLNSALSQPFDAEVELLNPTPEEITSMKVGLASQESFARFGLDRPSYLSSFMFKVEPTGHGHAIIHITSTRSIAEPVVSLLLEVSTATGRQMREYTVFLDPPVFVPVQPTTQPAETNVAPPPTEAGRTQGVIERKPPAQPEPTPQPATEATAQPATGVVPPPVTTKPAAPAEKPPAEESIPAPAETKATEPEQPAEVPQPVEATPAPGLSGDSYDVQRNDSLWKIAERLRPGNAKSINQTMIAFYRANPSAFAGNINRLRAGTVLRIPTSDQIDAVDRHDATAEVSRQYNEWRAASAAAQSAQTEESGHLQLVTPTETPAPAETAEAKQPAAETTAEKAAAEKAQAEQAKAEEAARRKQEADAEAKRLLDLKNEELARMQREREEKAAAEAKAAEAKKAEEEKAAEQAAAAAKPAEETPPAETAPPEQATQQPAEPAQQPATAQPKPAAKPPTAAPAAESPSLLDTLSEYREYIFGGLAVVVLLGGGLIYSRRRQAAHSSVSSFPMPDTGVPTMTPADFDAALEQGPMAGHDQFEPEPQYEAEHEAPESLAEAEGTKPLHGGDELPEIEPTPVRSADDTLSSETAIHVDQQDAVAEADFHMAYGLYDQAADLVKIAIGREPNRRDLKLKLLEIYFVWGNKDSFLETARELHESRDNAAAGEWDKVLIMGKQIAPDDPLFKGGSVGTSGDMLDVNLEGGENRVDFDLFSTPEAADAEPGAALDFDIGNTGARSKPSGHLDFLLDEGTANTVDDDTREMEPQDIDSNARTQETPTIESPVLGDSDQSLRESTVEMTLGDQQTDQTAELSIDDLGLDVGSLESTGSLERTTALSGARSEHLGDELIGDDELTRIAPAGVMPPGPAPGQEPTMEMPQLDAGKRKPNGHDDDEEDVGVSTIYLEQMENPSGDAVETLGPRGDETAHMLSPTDLDLDLEHLGTEAAEDDTIRSKAARIAGTEPTAEMPVIRPSSPPPDMAPTVEHPRPNMGHSDVMVATTDLPEMEPVTMSEVGTKLDLARAYMDMGDPDGARSILEEVLSEGNSGQRAEAQRLLDSVR